jgi:acyl transferase domain-containing protein
LNNLLERLTALDSDDLHSHALSLAAAEFAMETDNPAIGSSRLQVAHQLRAWEETRLHDGVAVPALEALRQAVDVPDAEQGQMAGLYAFRAEIDRLVAVKDFICSNDLVQSLEI